MRRRERERDPRPVRATCILRSSRLNASVFGFAYFQAEQKDCPAHLNRRRRRPALAYGCARDIWRSVLLPIPNDGRTAAYGSRVGPMKYAAVAAAPVAIIWRWSWPLLLTCRAAAATATFWRMAFTCIHRFSCPNTTILIALYVKHLATSCWLGFT